VERAPRRALGEPSTSLQHHRTTSMDLAMDELITREDAPTIKEFTNEEE
jgi:hypothetical protein